MNERLTVMIFVYFPVFRVFFFFFISILFIHFLPTGCALYPPLRTPLPLVLRNVFHACGSGRHLSTPGDRFAVNSLLLLSDCFFLGGGGDQACVKTFR